MTDDRFRYIVHHTTEKGLASILRDGKVKPRLTRTRIDQKRMDLVKAYATARAGRPFDSVLAGSLVWFYAESDVDAYDISDRWGDVAIVLDTQETAKSMSEFAPFSAVVHTKWPMVADSESELRKKYRYLTPDEESSLLEFASPWVALGANCRDAVVTTFDVPVNGSTLVKIVRKNANAGHATDTHVGDEIAREKEQKRRSDLYSSPHDCRSSLASRKNIIGYNNITMDTEARTENVVLVRQTQHSHAIHGDDVWFDRKGLLVTSISEGVAAFIFTFASILIAASHVGPIPVYDWTIRGLSNGLLFAGVSATLDGAMINPILSLVKTITLKMPFLHFLCHVPAQLVGSPIAAAIVRWGCHTDIDMAVPYLVDGPQWAGFIIEMIASYCLALAAIHLICSKKWDGAKVRAFHYFFANKTHAYTAPPRRCRLWRPFDRYQPLGVRLPRSLPRARVFHRGRSVRRGMLDILRGHRGGCDRRGHHGLDPAVEPLVRPSPEKNVRHDVSMNAGFFSRSMSRCMKRKRNIKKIIQNAFFPSSSSSFRYQILFATVLNLQYRGRAYVQQDGCIAPRLDGHNADRRARVSAIALFDDALRPVQRLGHPPEVGSVAAWHAGGSCRPSGFRGLLHFGFHGHAYSRIERSRCWRYEAMLQHVHQLFRLRGIDSIYPDWRLF
jgi:hypothetical protein